MSTFRIKVDVVYFNLLAAVLFITVMLEVSLIAFDLLSNIFEPFNFYSFQGQYI